MINKAVRESEDTEEVENLCVNLNMSPVQVRQET